jgi:hypothetical protein
MVGCSLALAALPVAAIPLGLSASAAAISSAVIGSLASVACVAAAGLQSKKSYTYVPDWMTTLVMRRSSPQEIRSCGLTRIASCSSLNIASEEYAALAHDTTELAALQQELNFQLSPAGRPGWN